MPPNSSVVGRLLYGKTTVGGRNLDTWTIHRPLTYTPSPRGESLLSCLLQLAALLRHVVIMVSKRTLAVSKSGPLLKAPRRHCSFKSAWNSQDFKVSVKGVERRFSESILSGVDGGDRTKCTLQRVKLRFLFVMVVHTMFKSTSAL